MDWFHRLTGFAEIGYEHTRSRLQVRGHELVSLVNGARYGIGEFELVSLRELRQRAAGPVGLHGLRGRPRVRLAHADVRELHRHAQNAGALFQVASQFNALEMVSPDVTPEQGVTRYQHDLTQGPACAIAAGAATIYRNYFVPLAGQTGQTSARQLDGLVELTAALAKAVGIEPAGLWAMRNGYALPTRQGLAAVNGYLLAADEAVRDELRGLLRVGLHWRVEVTDAAEFSDATRAADRPRPTVSQAFCSALPVAYTRIAAPQWEPLAPLVLEAAYEATLQAAVCHPSHGGTSRVLLTRLGGGAFGNAAEWIDAALRRALACVADRALDVDIIVRGALPASLRAIAREYA